MQAGCGHVAHPGFHCVATAPPSLVFLPLPGPKPEKPCLSVHSTVSMVSPSQVLGEKCVFGQQSLSNYMRRGPARRLAWESVDTFRRSSQNTSIAAGPTP